MQCEMCGTEAPLNIANIEGVPMKVCFKCSKFGKVIGHVPIKKTEVITARKVAKAEELEIVEEIVNNFAAILKREREKRKMEQTDFAKFLTEKESLLHKMESGHYKPTIETARKIEKILKVKLVETKEPSENSGIPTKTKSGALTIGDLIKRK